MPTRSRLSDFDLAFEPGAPVVAVSPHSDDAAFSVGGLLVDLAKTRPVTIATVYSQSAWTYAAPPEGATAETITRIRTEEDRAYCEAIGARYVGLALEDASLRGYDELSELRAPHRDDPAWSATRRALQKLLSSEPPNTVYLLPMAFGSHVDHVITHDVASVLLRRHARRVFYYEDLPYAACQDDVKAVERRAKTCGAGPLVVSIEGSLERKLGLLAGYRTQIEPGHLDAIRRYAVGRHLRASEVLWAARAPAEVAPVEWVSGAPAPRTHELSQEPW